MKRYLKLLIFVIIAAVVVGVLLDAGSVKRIDYDSVPGERSETKAIEREPYGTPSQPMTASPASRLAVGARFTSIQDLVNDQMAAGYVKIGTFGNHWPATVTEIDKNKGEIEFVRQDGSRHHYTKFNGYDMKMIRLMAGNQETVAIFRSQQKQ
ncbi:MAG: hypothetical protein ACWGOL_08145 [Desulfuromonadales bacterium]